MVRETAKAGASVGNAVTASDADNDPLLYEPGWGRRRRLPLPLLLLVPMHLPTAITNSSALFAIDNKSGQISVKSGANTSIPGH